MLGVYDGCGGRSGGGIASEMAARAIREELSLGAPCRSDIAARLALAVENAGHRVFAAATADTLLCGMGTAATLASIVGFRLDVAQVGDTRAYLLRGGALRPLTRDHSLFNDLLDAGEVRPEDEATFVHRGVITKALGTTERTSPTMTTLDLELGDRLLLCSDGVTVHLDDVALGGILRGAVAPDRCCRDLVAETYRRGASDNLTVVIADVRSES